MNSRIIVAALVFLAGLNVFQYSQSPNSLLRDIVIEGVASAAEEEKAEGEEQAGASSKPNQIPKHKIPRGLINRFHREFVKSQALLQNTWFGITTWQHPFDAWITQEIIWEVKPDIIIETGTYKGGSSALWATILEHANPDGRVLSIDAFDYLEDAARELPVVKRRVDFMRGSSSDSATLAEVAKRVKGKKVLVILDSDHHMKHVLGEMRGFAPMIPVGSYMIVQDTHLGDTVPFWMLKKEDQWIPGPLRAVEAFLAENDNFKIDHSRERLAATNNHNGFLKRIK